MQINFNHRNEFNGDMALMSEPQRGKTTADSPRPIAQEEF